MDNERRLSSDDLEMWKAAIQKYQKLVAEANSGLGFLAGIMAEKYKLTNDEQITDSGEIIKAKKE